ncbi:hypothetical protein BDN72DRAFT_850675 [Pluteus cervinus]|uniref:Uncharacterized protein n=1 Tax=Pluteus cervinus TaxID=181527 RepID=A0ACD3A372_9AGAR|nr:hypothetical protein BDN72DRAFT_850675 [Pluteus cervinus]
MCHFTKFFCLLTVAISASAGLIARYTPSAGGLQRRARVFEEVFGGTAVAPNDPKDRDAAIEGAGFLTFELVDSLQECFDFCDGIDGCVFVNAFDEFNDPNSPQPAHKCSAYSQVHGAEDKTNFGGQLLDPALGLTFIQDSVGFAAREIR